MTARKPKPHSETAWMPMLNSKPPRFFLSDVRPTRQDCRESFSYDFPGGWPDLKKQGWRIVRVRISVMTAGQIKAEKGTRR